jgi:hypothetical protein
MGLPDFSIWQSNVDGLRGDLQANTEAIRAAFPKDDQQHSKQLREWERFALVDGVVLSAAGAGTIGTASSNLRPCATGWEAYITSVAVTVGGASSAATVTNYNGEVDPTNLFDYANSILGASPSRIIAFYDAETVYVEQGDAISIVIAGGAASVQAFVRVCGKRRQL